MAGIMVSASTGVMNSLLGKLVTLMGEEFNKLKNLRKEVKSISEELRSMNNFLERLLDLDDLDKQTKGWRDEVREMSFDIEDTIDDFMQHTGENHQNSGIVEDTIERLKTLMAHHRVASRIKEIKKLVHETSERHKRYKLDISPSSDVPIDPRIATLYENAANLVGLEAPANELLTWLKDEEKQLKVVSIVGFGGLGKTTLANNVYRRLRGEFDCAAFVPVSQKPNIPKLILSLLYSLGGGLSFHDCELNVLLNKVREHLQNKRYLIVIDDIWDEKAWGVIKCAFPENHIGSRVLTTTRIHDVAKACCSHTCSYIFKMKPLSNEDSRRLFFGRIFDSEEACPHQLKDVSVEILKKCGGLPLAIITISSLLVSEGSNLEEWEHVQNSLGSATDLRLEGMRKILNLSYKNLPAHLKTCLLHLGMYPEDYIIERSDLERQWLAEGFVSKENGQDMEKTASNYFNELVNRSLIQPVKFDNKGSVTECQVHDMMLDLILHKSSEENFLTIMDGSLAIAGLDYKARRLSLRLDGTRNGTILPRNISMSQVRSLMIFGSSQNMPPLSEFKFLRVLFVDRYSIISLTGLSKLYQLRYLVIRSNSRWQLPTQIRGLQQLETLDLHSCSNIPSDIVLLPYLSHLSLGYNRGLPDGISNMKSLRYLSAFNFATNSLNNIKGLGELTNMRTLTLTCYGAPDDMVRRMDVVCSSLRKLCRIKYLYLYPDGCMDGFWTLSSPPRSLQRLHTQEFSSSCWFSRVPNWTRELHNLSELQLQVDVLLKDGIRIVAELPSLVCLDLQLRRPPKEMIDIYGRGAFPVLKRFRLSLSSASYLTFQAGAMPMLQGLELNFSVDGWKQNGAGPAGIQHLPELKEVSACIECFDATESEKRSAESALRSAVNMHPRHPRVETSLIKY